jgi:hypothetical protein
MFSELFRCAGMGFESAYWNRELRQNHGWIIVTAPARVVLVLARKQRLVADIFTCNMVQSCRYGL